MGTQNFEELISFYHNLNVYCAIAALVFLAIAILLFVRLKIPQVFGELTGRTAKKAINEMTTQGADSGSLASAKIGEDGRRRRKTPKTGSLGSGRIRQNTGKIAGNIVTDETEPVSAANAASSRVEPPKTTYEFSYPEHTEPIDNHGSEDTDVLDRYGSEDTDVLSNHQASFSNEETSVLDTTPVAPTYQAPISETMVLDHAMMSGTGKNEFVILRSIVEIHTDEAI